ncbi:MAG: alpha/beta hydrolase-fold protein [Bacteroidota bacterium]|nr:alpha/beta hydrolase-fold protein [Bacteroidota bacterium]
MKRYRIFGLTAITLLFFVVGKAQNNFDSQRYIELRNFSDKGVFDGTRNIKICLPPDYQNSQERYRVIYFFDGKRVLAGSQNNPQTMAPDYYHNELLKDGLIYPAIFVAMNDNGHRTKDLTPTKGLLETEEGGDLDKYFDFVAKVLKPYIDSHFRTKTEAEFTGIAGHSYGGLAAAWLAYMHPDVFGMAGVMSPSLWWDNHLLITKIEASKYNKPRPKFWVMSADVNDPGMWQDVRSMMNAFKAKGWQEGGNLSYNHAYGGLHDTHACNSQMRNMLYFLLGKEKPKLIGASVKSIQAEQPPMLDLESLGEKACVLLELQYANGYSTNAINAQYEIENNRIARIGNEKNGQILPLSSGTTRLWMSNGKAKASIDIKSFDCSSHEKYTLERSDSKVNIDGCLNDWKALKYSCFNEKDTSVRYKFDLKYDDKFLYIAIKVFDHFVSLDSTDGYKKRDRIVISLDAQKEPVRSMNKGLSPWSSFLSIGMAPGKTADKMSLERMAFEKRLPSDLKAVSIIDAEGYVSEVAIPISYIKERQGEDWNGVRLNIYQKKVNPDDGSNRRFYWRPDWKSKESYYGSGSFVRM